MRLIDADVLIDEINDEEFDTREDYIRIFNMVDDALTVDAELVKHAYWYAPNINKPIEWCSNCKRRTRYFFGDERCSNCGAKMDGGIEDEKDTNTF